MFSSEYSDKCFRKANRYLSGEGKEKGKGGHDLMHIEPHLCRVFNRILDNISSHVFYSHHNSHHDLDPIVHNNFNRIIDHILNHVMGHILNHIIDHKFDPHLGQQIADLTTISTTKI